MSVLFILTLVSVRKPTAGRIWGFLLEEFLSEKCENSLGHCSTILCARGVFGACLLLHIKSRAITYNSISIASGYDFICFHFFCFNQDFMQLETILGPSKIIAIYSL